MCITTAAVNDKLFIAGSELKTCGGCPGPTSRAFLIETARAEPEMKRHATPREPDLGVRFSTVHFFMRTSTHVYGVIIFFVRHVI